MRSQQDEQLLCRLREDVEAVSEDVVHLFWTRRWYRNLVRMVSSNPRINREHSFWLWVMQTYVSTVSVAVRRLLDKGDKRRTVSLGTITMRLAEHPGLISRGEYVGAYDWLNADIGHGNFDRFAGPGGQALSPQLLERRLEETRQQCTAVIEHVDKELAHRDRNHPGTLATSEIDDAIDATGSLFKDLYLLLKNADMSLELADQMGGNWLFREPWIRAESRS